MRNEFNVHRLNDKGLEAADLLASIFSDCLQSVELIVGPSRELSLVITKLQEAAFFAKRGMALKPENNL